MQPLFVANWKMNMLVGEAIRFVDDFFSEFTALEGGAPDVGIAPPFTAIDACRAAIANKDGVTLGSQNIHWDQSGAHTGEVSAAMLKEHDVHFAIVGHSERRQFYGETNECVSKRAKAAIENNIQAIVCVGESAEDFDANKTADVVKEQLHGSLAGLSESDTDDLIVAYEPVWAIGTGKVATPEIAANVHALVRTELVELFGIDAGSSVPILYGGSTKPENIAELISQPDVNGALVGGAALKPDVFWALVKNGRAAAGSS